MERSGPENSLQRSRSVRMSGHASNSENLGRYTRRTPDDRSTRTSYGIGHLWSFLEFLIEQSYLSITNVLGIEQQPSLVLTIGKTWKGSSSMREKAFQIFTTPVDDVYLLSSTNLPLKMSEGAERYAKEMNYICRDDNINKKV